MEITYKIIGTDGLQYGPIGLEQLKLWAGEGRITLETKVLRSDTNSWLPAYQYPELNLAQPAALPPTLATIKDPALEKQINSGAGWFFLIASLSLINSVIALSGNNIAFIFGLGITQIIDGVATSMGGSGGMIVAAVMDLLVAGVFIMFGVFGRKQHTWSFIAGMILYALDAMVLFLLGGGWLSLGLHVFALVSIFSGLRANTRLKALEKGLVVRPV
jgi:hypothetical protein